MALLHSAFGPEPDIDPMFLYFSKFCMNYILCSNGNFPIKLLVTMKQFLPDEISYSSKLSLFNNVILPKIHMQLRMLLLDDF